jgi:cytochrome o ubiquinol oxidase subunit 2
MRNSLKAVAVVAFAAFFVWLLWFLVQDKNIPILEPEGLVAQKERNLMYVATLLMLAIVLPVFALTGVIAWRYRAANRRAKYLPNWEHNSVEEAIWWAVPCFIIAILSVLTWHSTHDLDPFRPLPGEAKTIQVVSLNWKWLFIYPDEGIAAVNSITIPIGQPIEFRITADSPMNSFWIPQLGGQIYSMTGMVTKLHLITNTPGTYTGASANISGKGFSGMTFSVHAVAPDAFAAWVASTSANSMLLDESAYDTLAKPSEREPVRYYGKVQSGLFETIVGRFSAGMGSHGH